MTVILYLFIVILLTCIDQYSKFIIIQNLDLGEKIVLIEDFSRLHTLETTVRVFLSCRTLRSF